MYTTLIDAATLAAHLADPGWVVLDARFDLTAPERGEVLYRGGHIPGARYVSLDAHLSGVKTGANGRHPLPAPDVAAATFGALGVSRDRQVVLYDADLGMFPARGWWMPISARSFPDRRERSRVTSGWATSTARRLSPQQGEQVKVTVSTLGDDAVAIGAALSSSRAGA